MDTSTSSLTFRGDSVLLSRCLNLIVVIVVLLSVGTFGYCYLEGWSFNDAFYMTVITISTVGYTEIGELSSSGRAFTSFVILVSIVGMAYWTARVTSELIEGDLSGAFRKKRMSRMAKKLSRHTIVCGSGQYARSIIEMLFRDGRQFAIVTDDLQESKKLSASYPRVPIIELPPTDELALAKAGLTSASIIVAATDSGINNLLISMTCKQLNPLLKVYAFSFDMNLASRMMKVGVDEVICPHVLSGTRIAELISKSESTSGTDTDVPGKSPDDNAGSLLSLPQFQIPFAPTPTND